MIKYRNFTAFLHDALTFIEISNYLTPVETIFNQVERGNRKRPLTEKETRNIILFHEIDRAHTAVPTKETIVTLTCGIDAPAHA
jgi:hypothetical protein